MAVDFKAKSFDKCLETIGKSGLLSNSSWYYEEKNLVKLASPYNSL